MAMRLSGLMSGMDTESIVSQLVEARRVKVDNKVKAQTKLEWKQEAWKDLNTKLKNLQSKFVSTMRFSSAYAKKTTKVSDSSAASVITGENAVNGVQELTIEKLAKTGYLTGGEVSRTDGEDATAMTKMSELGFSGEASFNVKSKSGEAKTILFNLSGHGMVDMAAYDSYFSGEMQNYHVSDEELATFIKSADALNQ